MQHLCDNKECEFNSILLPRERGIDSILKTKLEDADGNERVVHSVRNTHTDTGRSVRLCGTCIGAVAAALSAAPSREEAPQP